MNGSFTSPYFTYIIFLRTLEGAAKVREVREYERNMLEVSRAYSFNKVKEQSHAGKEFQGARYPACYFSKVPRILKKDRKTMPEIQHELKRFLADEEKAEALANHHNDPEQENRRSTEWRPVL
ncbi:hypothetical protein Trydic_g16296 [Trypoxylus dichotomus]